MKIAFLTSQYPATSHTFIRREIEALRSRGLSIETFSVRRPASGEQVAERDRDAFETTYYLLPPSAAELSRAHMSALFGHAGAYFRTLALALRHRAPGLRALVWALFHFAESILLARELRRRNIEHLHNHFANAAANVGLLATHFLGLPWSLTLHGISETDYPAGLLLADKIRAAKFVACVSWFGRAQAMRITPPGEWHKFMIVRCGLDLRQLPQRTQRNEEPQVICVGRLSSEKGQAGLLEAFSALRDRGSRARLTLIGDGPEREALLQYCANLGVSEAVTFAGRKDEPETLRAIANADLLVLPSFMEGLPIVLMEAMAMGVPVVASHVAGIPELIEDGKEGLLFRPADWQQLSMAMEKLLLDQPLRASLSAAARLKIEREFDISLAAEPLAARFRAGASENATLSGGGKPSPLTNNVTGAPIRPG